MERKFNKGDIVQHFKREKMTDEQLRAKTDEFKEILKNRKIKINFKN